MPYAITIFVSAFLLFQVQPIIARFILPWYGGSPAVWSTTLLFFQVFLLLGYAYAHLIAERLTTRQQVVLHIGLLIIALLVLPITPDDAMKPDGEGSPLFGILRLLATTVGLPYLLISATGPLLQHWFYKKYQDRSPYRLYALSNVGSLLGLLTYPLWFERMFTVSDQTLIWSVGFAVFVLLCGWSGIVLYKSVGADEKKERAPQKTPSLGIERPLLWLGLAACGSTMLLATTNKITQDVAVVPFLWVLPLSLYLLTFIIAFDSPRWYKRVVWVPMFVLSIGLMALLLNQVRNFQEMEVTTQVLAYLASLFFICLVCHGEMARLKPDSSKLTYFYLMVALGGALGGVFVSFVAPVLFRGFWEFHIGLSVSFCLCGYVILKYSSWNPSRLVNRFAIAGWYLMLFPLAGLLIWEVNSTQTDLVGDSRNFYGVLRIYERDSGNEDHRFELHHGRIKHGIQMVDPDLKYYPSSYYSLRSGIGLSFKYNPKRLNPTNGDSALRIGVVGLGVGTIASYCQPGDYFRFYEIDPAVTQIAETKFSYLGYKGCKYDVIHGDGRISLEREFRNQQFQKFDILVVDAFSGDAIPIHLLTQEAFDLYFQHLNPDGILALHVTNRYLDLKPVVFGLASQMGINTFEARGKKHRKLTNGSDWFLLTRNSAFMTHRNIRGKLVRESKTEKIIWTDDYSNLLQVLKQK